MMDPDPGRNTPLFQWFALIILALIWGSSFILMKRGLDVFPSDQVGALRMFIAFIALAPLAYRYADKSAFKHWKAFLAVGMFGNFIPAFLFTKAETGISSSLTGMLNSLTPLFTLLLGVALFRVKTSWVNVLGILMGFAGAIGLLTAGETRSWGNNIGYGTYVIIATLCYAISVNVIKKYLNEVNSITTAVFAFCLVGPPAGIYLLATDFTQRMNHPLALESLGYICILAVLGTALSVIIFNLLVRRSNALFASSVTYLIPIVAIMWGLLDGENIYLTHFLSILVILLGVYLVNKKKAAS